MIAFRCEVLGYALTLDRAIDRALEIAGRLDMPIVFTFNGTDVVCAPGMAAVEVKSEYIRRVGRDDEIRRAAETARRPWWKWRWR